MFPSLSDGFKSILLIKACLIVVENLLYDTERVLIFTLQLNSAWESLNKAWKDRVDRLEERADCRSVPGWTAGELAASAGGGGSD